MKFEIQGKQAEFFARLLFVFKGYKIVAKNYITGKGTGAGEIDFIARKKDLLVFVEVKKRKNLEAASYAISENQQKRISRGAEAFIKKNRYYNSYNLRFDVVLVSPPFFLKHIKNAWWG